MSTSALGIRHGMRDDRRRKRRHRLGVLPALLRIGIPAARRLVSLALLCLLFGRRHPFRLRSHDLLVRQRELVLNLVHALGELDELSVALGELLLELCRVIAPTTVVFLPGQRAFLITFAAARRALCAAHLQGLAAWKNVPSKDACNKEQNRCGPTPKSSRDRSAFQGTRRDARRRG